MGLLCKHSAVKSAGKQRRTMPKWQAVYMHLMIFMGVIILVSTLRADIQWDLPKQVFVGGSAGTAFFCAFVAWLHGKQ